MGQLQWHLERRANGQLDHHRDHGSYRWVHVRMRRLGPQCPLSCSVPVSPAPYFGPLPTRFGVYNQLTGSGGLLVIPDEDEEPFMSPITKATVSV